MVDFFYWNEWSRFEFPLNLLGGTCLVLLILVLSCFYKDKRWVKKLAGTGFTFTWMILCILVLVLEGIFAWKLYASWPFIVFLGFLLLHLGIVIVRHHREWDLKYVLFLLNHLGLWLTLAAALLGAPDVKTLKMVAPRDRPENIAIDAKGEIYRLPFTVTLQQFEAEFFPGRQKMPKSFRSKLFLQSREQKKQVMLEVNKPVRFNDYTIYQDGYDFQEEKDAEYVVLQFVRDPWLPWVYMGILMMLMGSLGLIFIGPLKKKKNGIGLE